MISQIEESDNNLFEYKPEFHFERSSKFERILCFEANELMK